MRSVVVIALFGAALLTVTGCEPMDGACVSAGGIVDECKSKWSQSECDDWNAQQINGANWSFHEDRSCPSLGYTVQCSDGSYVRPEDASVCGR